MSGSFYILTSLFSWSFFKTADSLIIELNRHSRAILEKYKDVSFEGDKVLPVISNQKMNDYIKELWKLA